MTQPQLQTPDLIEDEEDEKKGKITLDVINTRNSRTAEFKVQPKRLMSKVRDRAYRKTHDQIRAGDHFDCASGYRLQAADFEKTYEDLTKPGGPCPGERSFRIVGDAQGA